MSARKSERLLNLLIMLLVQRSYVSKARIREILYPEASDEAFDRMFDRDKDELRNLGVPIETGSIDPLFDDEPGYRIRPDEMALPPVELSPDEAAVVGLAARVWENAKLAEATADAVRKLTSFGVDVDLAALDIAQPRISAEEPAFDVFWDAIGARRAVRFDYRRPGQGDTSRRTVHPWGVVRHSGRWYVVGYDVDRADERVFRLSRVEGEASGIGRTGAYEIPADVDVHEVARRLAPTVRREQAQLCVRQGSGHSLRTDADRIEIGVAGPDQRTGWDRVEVTRTGYGLVEEILEHGADVFVEGPEELRTQVIGRLQAIEAGGR